MEDHEIGFRLLIVTLFMFNQSITLVNSDCSSATNLCKLLPCINILVSSTNTIENFLGKHLISHSHNII